MLIDECKGSDESVLLHWQDKLRVHETTVPRTEFFSENMKTIMLGNAVTQRSHVKQVKEMTG